MKQKSLKKNVVFNTLRTLFSLVFPLITFPYTSRILLPEGIGKVNFCNTIISLFSIIAGLGIATYGTREAAKIRDDKEKLSQFTKEVFIINILSTFVAYILFFIALFFVPKLHDYRILLIACSCSMILSTIGMDWLYSALEEFKYIAIRSFVFQIISLVLLFTFVKTKDDVLIYALINIVSSVGISLLNFFNARKFINKGFIQKIEIKKHLKPIFVLFAMTIATSIYTYLDTAMLGFLAGDLSVGLYSASIKITKIVLSLVAAFTTVFMPRLSFCLEKGDKIEFNNLIVKSANALFCFMFPCFFGLFLLRTPIILLLSGNNFIDAIPTMAILTPIIIMIGISNFIGIQLCIPMRKEKITLISVIFGAIINFFLNLILIPRFKEFGAGISTLVAEICVTIIQIILIKKSINIGKLLLSSWQYIVASIVMSFFVIIILNFIDDYLLQTILSIVIGSIVYVAFLLIIKNKFVVTIINRIIKSK